VTDSKTLFLNSFLESVKDAEQRTGFPAEEFRAGGRATKQFPNKEDANWWAEHGPGMVEDWEHWWDLRKSEGWTIWVTPNGDPAVELGLSVEIGGTFVRMYLDAIFVDQDGDLIVTDWKSGSMEPAAPIQLGLYRVALKKTFDVDVRYGGFWMAKKLRDFPRLYDLSIYTEDVVGRWLNRAAVMEKERIFIPHPSGLCNACGVREYCLVMGGAEAHTVPAF